MLKNRWSFLLLSLCLSAVVLHSASAATTLAQAGAQTGRTIGVAIEANLLGNNPYTTIAQTQFDGVTPGNEMKWQTTEPSQGTFNFGPADQIVSFAQSHNMKIRGHTLVWHSQLAGWVNNISSGSALLAAMNNHITNEMSHFKNAPIWYWDVVNEAFNDNGTRRGDPFQDLIGNAYIEDAFRTAHNADSGTKLCYNDFNIEDMNSAKSQAVFAMVSDFKNRGVPIDCVGFQSHFIVRQVPADFQATLQKFANLGIDVQVTELDVRMPTPASSADLNQQGTDYANVAKACLAVSRCNDITVWGVGEPDSWVPGTFSGQGQALLYDQNYQPKSAFTAFLNALGGSGGGTPPPTFQPPTNTPSASGIDPTRWYQVINQNTGICVDDANFGTTNGSIVQQFSCSGGINQRWKFTPTSNGFFQVTTQQAQGLVWDVIGVSTADGAGIQLFIYGGGQNQQWLPQAVGGGFFKFTARHSGKCLTSPSTGNGVHLTQSTCTGGSNQAFRLQ